MKLIYDREKAISRKEEIDKETEEENKWREKENRKAGWKGIVIAALLIVLIIGATIFMVSYICTADDTPIFIGLGSVLAIFAILGAFYLIELDMWEMKTIQYPVDVEYFLKTDGYNVLQVFAKKSDSGYHGIYADREDKDHKVETVCIGFLKDTVRADIPIGSEPVADLEAGEYCVPYKRKEEKEKNEKE